MTADLTRRSFFTNVGRLVVLVPAGYALLAGVGCGTDSNPDCTTAGTVMSTGAALVVVSTCSGAGKGHTHDFTIQDTDLAAPPAAGVSGNSSPYDDDRWATMRHEAVHMRQFRRWTRPGMALLYLLLPLPMGLAYFRMRFERAAYEETIRCGFELYGMAHVREHLREHILEQFTGPSYGWMWPFRRSLERWYDVQIARLAAA